MGNVLENHFNRRNHVANAYDEDVYAKVISDKVSQSIRDEVKLQFKGVTLGRQNNRELGLFYNCQFWSLCWRMKHSTDPSAAEHGFTVIAPNTYLAFAPDAERTAYISVYTEGGRIVSTNYPVHENRSVIVNRDGYLREAEYGTIWTER